MQLNSHGVIQLDPRTMIETNSKTTTSNHPVWLDRPESKSTMNIVLNADPIINTHGIATCSAGLKCC